MDQHTLPDAGPTAAPTVPAPGAVPGAVVPGAAVSGVVVPGAAVPGVVVPGAAFTAAPATAAEGVSAWAGLRCAVQAVAGEPAWRLGEEELVERLRDYEAVRARLDAHRLGLVRELDARGWAASVGATSTQAWLAHALRTDPRAAAADVRAARALNPTGDTTPEPGVAVMSGAARSEDDPALAATGRALAGGAVSRAHADAVLASVRALPAHPNREARDDLTTRAEGWLLEQCAAFDPATVRRLGREVVHAVDPTGVLAEELAGAARDELWLTPTPTGRVRLRGEVDQVTGALLTTLVDAGAAPRPSAADGPDTRPA